MSNLKLEIQGLRAFAVSIVVIFHLLPFSLPGGFVGVDVFFVISGFLITSMLYPATSNTPVINLTAFYFGRARRLFPALLVLLFFCCMIATYSLLPDDLITFSYSLQSTLLYVSNWYFASQSGYFSDALGQNLLLHTWSLGVEEQFYLLFPLLLLLCQRLTRQQLIWLLAGLCILSFGASVYAIDVAKDSAFFASPLRFFQFWIGSILALSRIQNKLDSRLNDLLSLLSVLALLYCCFYYNKSTAFPGFAAALPSFATLVLIFSLQDRSSKLRYLFTNPVAVGVGNISYSVYLWHWPLIVFYKMEISVGINFTQFVLLFMLSLCLGWLSWRFVEKPFRSHHSCDQYPASTSICNKKLLIGLLISTGLLFAFTFVVLEQQGFSDRFSRAQLRTATYLKPPVDNSRRGQCFITSAYADASGYDADLCLKPDKSRLNVLLLGDSHAAHWYHQLKSGWPAYHILQANASGCKPLLDSPGDPRCTTLMTSVFTQTLEIYKYNAFVLSARWDAKDLPQLVKTVNYLSKFGRVYVIGPLLQYNQSLPRLLIKYADSADAAKQILRHSNIEKVVKLDLLMKERLQSLPVQYLSLFELQCQLNQCIFQTEDQIPLQWDFSHLTDEGAKLLLNKLDIQW
jgi:peptidoglycan/LPS O-acetylase OafA/YrhL